MATSAKGLSTSQAKAAISSGAILGSTAGIGVPTIKTTASKRSSGSSDPASSLASQLSAAMDRIYMINQENTARSERQAAELRDWQAKQNQIAMDFNSSEAAKNRNWQQMMSDTAHQREVRDLQAAGLNPILSASGGNGAAVGSGATASGVTSSGAKGEVDTSATQALVGLLGTMWQAQTTLESQRLTAQNNMAIAEKNNASAQAIAQMQTQSQQQIARIAGQYNLDVANIQSAASRLAAQIHAGATRDSAAISAAAHRYAADMGYSGYQLQVAGNLIAQEARNQNTLEVAQLGYQQAIETAGIHATSALDVAKENHWNSLTGFSMNMGDRLASYLPWFNKSTKRGGFSSREGGFSRR